MVVTVATAISNSIKVNIKNLINPLLRSVTLRIFSHPGSGFMNGALYRQHSGWPSVKPTHQNQHHAAEVSSTTYSPIVSLPSTPSGAPVSTVSTQNNCISSTSPVSGADYPSAKIVKNINADNSSSEDSYRLNAPSKQLHPDTSTPLLGDKLSSNLDSAALANDLSLKESQISPNLNSISKQRHSFSPGSETPSSGVEATSQASSANTRVPSTTTS